MQGMLLEINEESKGCKPCFYNRVYSFIEIQRKLQTEYQLHITFSEMMQKFQNKQC